MIVYFSWMFTYEFIKGQFKNHTIVIGIVIMIFFISSDLLRFNLQKYTQVFGNQKFTSQICIGTLIFVITLLLDFCLEIGRMLYEMAQRETLEGIAYTDVLTGLVNRRKCEEIFDELEKLEIPYEIINFDLNGLKIVNDQLGHDCGDQLIKEFSKILKVVFSDYATVGRMGGDEFIVIFKNSSNVNIEKLIDTMQRLIEVHNEKDKLIRISTAYGFCSSVENPLFTVKEVYRVADARMYKMKAESKRLRENKVF